MSAATGAVAAPSGNASAARVPLTQLFLDFLLIGATSFGGGAIAFVRNTVVEKRHWLDDKEFVELLSISQALPGLNSTNLSILIGDRLRGGAGSTVAILGMCLPGGLFMYFAAIAYAIHGDRTFATAGLKGIAAAAVGILLSTAMQLGRRALSHRADIVFVALAVIGVNRLHLSVLTVLAVVGLSAILWYRPGGRALRAEALAPTETAHE
jgi:chromate transporter